MVMPYLDNSVPPGPGEEEEEKNYDLLFVRRVRLVEEILLGRGGKGGRREGENLEERD